MLKKAALSLLLLCLFTLQALGQPGSLVSVTPNVVPRGYTGNITITGSGTTFNVATCGINLRLIHSGGTIYDFGNAPGGIGWFGGPFQSPPATSLTGAITLPANCPMGSYSVQLRGYTGDNCFTQNMYYAANALLEVGAASTFMGQVVLDRDSSCSRNGNDVGLGNHLVTINPGPYYAVTQNDGTFEASLFPGNYTFSIAPPSGANLYCPLAPLSGSALLPNDTATGLDFFVVGTGNPDLQATLICGPHRPGFNNAHSYLVVRNLGFEPAQNVFATLEHPSSVANLTYDLNPSSVSGNTATWNLGTLNGGASVTIMSTGEVQFVPLGSVWAYTGIVGTSTPESDYGNNSSSGMLWVTGAHDPNDKQVWTADGTNADGPINQSDSLLRYLVRFQNTGNDTAFNIYILDTLDQHLDISSLNVEAASAPYQVLFMDSTGHRVKFLFENILLPDSNRNEPKSHGYIQYTIRQPGNLATGMTISNSASIYFDFNPPVITNTVTSTICPAFAPSFTTTGMAPSVNFSASNTGNPSRWDWDFGDGSTGSGQNVTHVYAAPGTYQVCLVMENFCGRIDTICQSVQVIYVSTIGRMDAITSLSLAPQPGHEWVRLELQTPGIHDVRFELLDIQGQKVGGWEERSIGGTYTKDIDLSGFASGMYFLQIRSEEGMHVTKMMVD
ncbi:MAG: PKD domain-containing protein [Bacteroidia bacterium]